jgi:hypothetical protein
MGISFWEKVVLYYRKLHLKITEKAEKKKYIREQKANSVSRSVTLTLSYPMIYSTCLVHQRSMKCVSTDNSNFCPEKGEGVFWHQNIAAYTLPSTSHTRQCQL